MTDTTAAESPRLSFTVTVAEDPATGELLLPIPPAILEAMGWREGDTLEWTVEDDGAVSVRKMAVGPSA